MKNYPVTIESLTDFGGTLLELLRLVEDAINTYGKDAIVSFDAGANNVQVFVEAKACQS